MIGSLQKGTSLHQKAQIASCKLWRVAKQCRFIEIIGDTFA
jgi:hypothetical protein